MSIFGGKSPATPREPHVGTSGKHYYNPKVMESHGDMPTDNMGHPTIHHIEIMPKGATSNDPHHVDIHGHDGQVTDGGDHASYDDAAMAAKSNIDEVEGDDSPAEEANEDESSMMPMTKAKHSEY